MRMHKIINLCTLCTASVKYLLLYATYVYLAYATRSLRQGVGYCTPMYAMYYLTEGGEGDIAKGEELDRGDG